MATWIRAIATIYIVIIGTVNHPNMQMNAAEFMESKKLAINYLLVSNK